MANTMTAHVPLLPESTFCSRVFRENNKMLRAAFGLAVLVVLALFLDWSFLAGLSARQYALSAGIVLVLVVCTWFEAARLHALCQDKVSRLEILRVIFIGYFVTNFTPSSLGGDGYKVYALGRTLGYSSATAFVLLERSMGLAVLLSVAALAVFAYGDQWASAVIDLVRDVDLPSVPAGSSLLLIGAVILLAVIVAWPWRARIFLFAQSFLLTLRNMPPSALLRFCFMTVFLHAIRAAMLCLQLSILGYDLAVPEAWVVLTIGAVASMLPVAPAGLGVREAATVVALAPFGVDYQAALFVALIMRLANVVQAVLGALLLPGGPRLGQAMVKPPGTQ